MTIIKIDTFGGIAPRYSARLLQQNQATLAQNAKLLSGELRGLHETSLLHDFNPSANPVQRAFRLPASVNAPIPIGNSDQWIPFYDQNVDFVRTPVLQDSFERYYWTGDSFVLSGQPQYNTRARINASSAPFLLGVPTPVNLPIVTPPAGLISTRSYVYTFVSAYGEEGPPSSPTQATGTTGTWVISNFDTTVPNAANRNITSINIYRTVTGANTTEYYYVATIALGTTTYNDVASDVIVASNTVLPSLTWTQPPSTLQGLTAHPGGFLVGFSGRDLWMSEPYHPHAWPLQYVQTMQTEIVGIAIYNNVVIVTTTSHPYIAEGMSPLALTFQKIDSIDPCVSRRSIAVTLDGVYYASPQGIIRAAGGTTKLVSYNMFTREEWQNQFTPTGIKAVPYGVQYIAFDSTATGFIYSPSETLAPLTTLDRFSFVTGIQIDQYSGDVYIIQNNQIRLWDPPTTNPFYYTWQSKQFDLPNPLNMGAFRVKFAANPISISLSVLSDYTTFNAGRITTPLNCLNLATVNGVRTAAVTGYYGPQIRNPLGGSPLFPIAQYTNQNVSVNITIWARNLNSVWEQIYSQSISDERIHRLPSGYKSDAYQIRLISNTPVYNLVMAETGKELKGA